MSSLTQRDNGQIERHEHDESLDAKRVYIVGGGDIKITADASQIADSISSAIKESIGETIPLLKPQEDRTQLQIVEIEKPVVIKEPQIVEIEKQIVVKEKEIVDIDKPVIMEKIVYKEQERANQQGVGLGLSHATVLVLSVVLQTLTILGLIFLKS
jgi:hypothetical protein